MTKARNGSTKRKRLKTQQQSPKRSKAEVTPSSKAEATPSSKAKATSPQLTPETRRAGHSSFMSPHASTSSRSTEKKKGSTPPKKRLIMLEHLDGSGEDISFLLFCDKERVKSVFGKRQGRHVSSYALFAKVLEQRIKNKNVESEVIEALEGLANFYLPNDKEIRSLIATTKEEEESNYQQNKKNRSDLTSLLKFVSYHKNKISQYDCRGTEDESGKEFLIKHLDDQTIMSIRRHQKIADVDRQVDVISGLAEKILEKFNIQKHVTFKSSKTLTSAETGRDGGLISGAISFLENVKNKDVSKMALSLYKLIDFPYSEIIHKENKGSYSQGNLNKIFCKVIRKHINLATDAFPIVRTLDQDNFKVLVTNFIKHVINQPLKSKKDKKCNDQKWSDFFESQQVKDPADHIFKQVIGDLAIDRDKVLSIYSGDAASKRLSFSKGGGIETPGSATSSSSGLPLKGKENSKGNII